LEDSVADERRGLEEHADQLAMQRLAEGDPVALRPLFDRWKRSLLTYFYRALGSMADAEDLALQVFEKLYRAAPRYRPEARFSSWLFAIARNELRHELRRRRRKPVEALPPEALEWAMPEVPSERIAREWEETLLHALQTLPERERSALLLTAAGELDRAAIAESLGTTVNHLYVIVHRARQRLRDHLD